MKLPNGNERRDFVKNFWYEGRRFANGNLNIRFSPEEIEEVMDSQNAAIALVCNKLDAFDCTPVTGYPESLGNANWYLEFECAYNGMNYRLLDLDLITLLTGKTVKLIPY